jgi:heterodisulfide reductase subunit A
MASIKHAYILKSKLGDEVDVYVCYTDIRSFGKGHEELYRKAREAGVKFIRARPSDIRELPDGSLYFDVFDAVTNLFLRVNVDMIILMAGAEPSKGTEELGKMLKIPIGPEGFFTELHPKLRPVETVTDGIYVAGACQGSKDITDTIGHAGSAAAAVESLLVKGVVEIPPIIAVVDEEICSGCGACVDTCAYGAIALEEIAASAPVKRAAKITSAKCKGCGACAAACPSNAIRVNHFIDQQILAMVQEAFV